MEYMRLGDIATYINGYAFKPEQWSSSGKKIIRIQNLNNKNAEYNYFDGDIDEKYIVKKGDILISWSASIGVYEWNLDDSLLNQHIFKVKFDKIYINKKYFSFIVSLALERAVQYMHGSTMKHITKKYFDNIVIPIPRLELQNKIAEVLDKAQELIDKRKEQIEALDELVKSKFIEMFGDPVNNNKNLEITTIGEIVTDVRYGTSKPAVDGGKFPYLRMNNITYNGYLDLDNLKYIDIDNKELEKCIIRKGDVLFNRTNSAELIGKTCVFNLDTPMVIAGYIIRIRLTNEILPIYLSMFLNSDYGKNLLRSMAKGAANQVNINAQELKSIKITKPPIDMQNEFADFVEQVDKLKAKMEESLKELEDNFNSLMQRAFKGELFN